MKYAGNLLMRIDRIDRVSTRDCGVVEDFSEG